MNARGRFGVILVLLCVTAGVRAAASDVADAIERGDLAAARALVQKGRTSMHRRATARPLGWVDGVVCILHFESCISGSVVESAST